MRPMIRCERGDSGYGGDETDSCEAIYIICGGQRCRTEILRVACAKAGLTETSFHIARDGLQAISYLESSLAIRNALPRPTHVFTDINMPLYDGLRLLWWIRTHPDFKDVHVTVLTNDCTEEIKERAMRLGCDACLQKPSTLDAMVSLIGGALGGKAPAAIVS